MRSPDERVDEELRKALKDRFDSYERLPNPSLREKIFKAIGGDNGIIQKGLIATLLLLIVMTGVMLVVLPPNDQKDQTTAAQERKADGPGKRPSQAPERASRAHLAAGATRAGAPVNPLSPSGSRKKVSGKSAFQKAARQAARRVVNRPNEPSRRMRKEVAKIVEMMKSNQFGSLWINEKALSPADRDFLYAELKKIGLGDDMADVARKDTVEAKIMEGQSVADQDIGVLDHRPLTLPQYHWRPDSLVTPGRVKKRYDFHFKEHWGIIGGITPLRTFQILTVRPGNGVVYQNFVLPTKISAETVGYKFSAGVQKNGFQLLINYGQFRQSYKYEIATGEFLVGPDLSGNYEVVRKGIPQEESSAVRLLGLSVRKHTVRRSSFLRNYYGDVGAEFTRDLTSRRNMVWVNAGIGKELSAGRNTTLTVGPYFEYSLMKLSNPDNPFRIQPYQVGLSVGLRYNTR